MKNCEYAFCNSDGTNILLTGNNTFQENRTFIKRENPEEKIYIAERLNKDRFMVRSGRGTKLKEIFLSRKQLSLLLISGSY